MTNLPYAIAHLNPSKDVYIFHGNTVINDPIPDNATVIVKGGALIVANTIGRDVNISTRSRYPLLQLAAAKITNNMSFFPVEPEIILNLGPWNLPVKPLDIVILSEPQDFSAEDALYKLPVEYPLCTLKSGGDVFYLKDTAERTTANVDGSFCCLGTLGKLGCINSAKGAFVCRIGDLCTVTTSGYLRAGDVGIANDLSCAKDILLGPSSKGIKWIDSAATAGGALHVFGPELKDTTGINAKIITHAKGTYSPYKGARVPKNLPGIEKMIVG